MAVVGRRLFYIVDGNAIGATEIGGKGAEQSLVSVPQCQGIHQLAAAGNELAYLVTSPSGPSAQIADCGGAGTVSWSIWLLDLDGGLPRQVASGARNASTIDVAEFPVHMALSDTAYAYSRPPVSADAGKGDAVEVHAIDGRLLWNSQTTEPVADVMLGGATLAVLTDSLAGGSSPFDLWTSQAARPDLELVVHGTRSASLSPDGLNLTWEATDPGGSPATNAPVEVSFETVGLDRGAPLSTPTNMAAPAPLRPGIWSIGSRLAVTWFATAPSGAVYPAIRLAAGADGIFLPSLQEPVWMEVQRGTLIWVAEGGGGWSRVAFAVDLAALSLN